MLGRTRGRLYVDKDVQLALLWQLFRHWALFVGMLTGMLLALEALSGGTPRTLSEYFTAVWAKHTTLFVTVISLFPVFVYDSVRLSNRFVGPILRLRRGMREIAAGEEARPIHFRKEDFWQDMAESFNQLLARLDDDARVRGKDQKWVKHTEEEKVEEEKRALVVAGPALNDSEET